jgi:hypothetical protein
MGKKAILAWLDRGEVKIVGFRIAGKGWNDWNGLTYRVFQKSLYTF